MRQLSCLLNDPPHASAASTKSVGSDHGRTHSMVASPPHPQPITHKMVSTMPARVRCGMEMPKVSSTAIRTGPIHSPKLCKLLRERASERAGGRRAVSGRTSVLRPLRLPSDLFLIRPALLLLLQEGLWLGGEQWMEIHRIIGSNQWSGREDAHNRYMYVV